MSTRFNAIVVSLVVATASFAQNATEPALRGLKISTQAETNNQIPKFTSTAGVLTDSIMYESGGNIGVGTNVPKSAFHIFGTPTSDVILGTGFDPSYPGSSAFNFGYSGASLGRGSGFFNVRPDASAVAPNPSLRFMTVNVERMIITNTGNVGIGIPIPNYKLHVNGTARFEGEVTGTRITAHYQDVAEWVPSNDDLSAGTVVVLDASIGNGIMASSRAYDTTVAGVVSEQPGIVLGEESPDKEMVATTGRVRMKVDASRAPIAVGDLLVTSDKPGYAMRSTPIDVGGALLHRPGTIVGKALETLGAGQGEILVLLSLQ